MIFKIEVITWLILTSVLLFIPLWFLIYKIFSFISFLVKYIYSKYQYRKNINQLKKQVSDTSFKITKALSNNISRKKSNIRKVDIAKLERIKVQALAAKERWKLDTYEKKLIEGLSIDPENLEFLKMLSTYYFNIWKYKKSLPLLKKILDIKSDEDVSLWQMGKIYLESGDIDTAYYFIQKAIEINKKNPKYYITLAEIYYEKDQISKSIKALQECVKLRPSNINYLLSLASLYEDIWEFQNAKKYYFKVLELDPTNEIAKSRLENL